VDFYLVAAALNESCLMELGNNYPSMKKNFRPETTLCILLSVRNRDLNFMGRPVWGTAVLL